MTSKLTFRARTLDAAKPMAIHRAEELPELVAESAINRAVPPLPTGMEKEEETEKHLQDILEAQNKGLVRRVAELVIPTPEVIEDNTQIYENTYKGVFKQPRQYIHVQPFSADQDLPDYDMDDEDIKFFEDELRDRRKFEVSMITFEDMIDRLEKNSGSTVVNLKEAKMLLKEDDDLILAVYDYWLNKRLETQQCLIPLVKTEAKENAPGGGINPYVAFRRRTEKMQTRKNRKNDEDSYIRMLKLRRDLNRSVMLLDLVKKREKMKKENLNLTTDIFEKRFQIEDWDGSILQQVQAKEQTNMASGRKVLGPATYPLTTWANSPSPSSPNHSLQIVTPQKKEKRIYRKRKHHKSNRSSLPMPSLLNVGCLLLPAHNQPDALSSDDDRPRQSDHDDEDDLQIEDGPFTFKRKAGVEYHPVLDDPEDSGMPHHLFMLPGGIGGVSKDTCIGYSRRRLGRGGRVVLDRIPSRWDSSFTCRETNWRSDDWVVRPRTPPSLQDSDWDPYKNRTDVIAGV